MFRLIFRNGYDDLGGNDANTRPKNTVRGGC